MWGRTAICSLLLVLVSVQARGESDFTDTRVSLMGDIGSSRTMGFKVPFLGVGAGLDIQSAHYLLQGDGFFSRTDKESYANLTQFYGDVRVLIVVNRLGFGGGSTWSHLKFNDLDTQRWAVRPFVSAGFVGRQAFVVLEWVFPGQDKAYRVQRLNAYVELAPLQDGKHFRMGYAVSYTMIQSLTGNLQNKGLEGHLYLKLYL